MKKPRKPNGDDGMDKEKASKVLKGDKKQIEEFLQSAMQDFLVRKSGLNSEKTKNLNNLVTLISEYLSAFIIIGYDISGESVNLVHATNQMDADALSAAINKFILNSINGPSDSK